jgi:Carboxypeptidase regulatory-like domain
MTAARIKIPLLMLTIVIVAVISALCGSLLAQDAWLKGRVTDPAGNNLPRANVLLLDHGQLVGRATTNENGRFQIALPSARQSSTEPLVVKVEASGFRPVERPVVAGRDGEFEITVKLTQLLSREENVTVTADLNETDVLSPDPAEKVFVRQDLLDANPGRPGAPVSIPGYPIETASSGIKAPQYFAPGVAGDHGEPIAQYIAVGSYLVPNNLSANAHGNGYADPNIFIPEIIESVEVDGGAFNVREGNHSVNLAATYGLRSHLDPFVTITGDYRDLDVVAGWSPSSNSFLALEGSYGNGFLDRLEHRQQYKFNGQRVFHLNEHRLTLFGIGYFGRSYVPGLVPIFGGNRLGGGIQNDFQNSGDTVDPRQKDQTHTALVALNDVWQLSGNQQLHLSAFFRTYNLSLFSDFGEGLIRQSEFRTVAGGGVNYVNKISESLSLLGGFDYEREAPRRDDLDRYGFFNASEPAYYGPFTPVDGNNVTIGSFTPYVAAEGAMARYFRYYLGWRRDEIDFDNEDLLHSQNSFQKWVGVNSPKATISFLPKEAWYVPLISLSFGQSFFTEDPRIGLGTGGDGATVPGTPVATAHSYQLVASKIIRKTNVKLTLGHVTSSAELAKIDPDTGLQINGGAGRLRFMTVAVRRNFSQGSFLATFSKADARDLGHPAIGGVAAVSAQPTPEAPRTIFDLLGTVQKLPWGLQARGEFEYVGAKPLGIGCNPISPDAECVGVPVKEFRGALARPFMNGRITAGVNFLVASGYTGQTTENFSPSDVEEIVGVRIPSYASASLTYRFGR